MSAIRLVESATKKFLDWVAAFTYSDEDLFYRAQVLATRLGAYYRPDGLTEVAFWIPDVGPSQGGYWSWSTVDHYYQIKSAKDIFLEVWTPLESIHFRDRQQRVSFRRDRLPLQNHKDYFCGVFEGMQPGSRDQAGCFYWLRYIDRDDQIRTVGDELAVSLPYGVFAPAELYDIDSLQRQRIDREYFSAGSPGGQLVKVQPPRNILQLHVNTASREGSLEGVTRIYQRIAKKLKSHQPLTPAEENYIGYDAVQLLPIEPIVEYLEGDRLLPQFFSWDPEVEADAAEVQVTLKKPNSVNWGYDIVISASSAINPAVLASLRPDELIDFIATLHTFPSGPIQVIYDIVFGHTDNQSLSLLNRHYLKGPNMYGQDVNHQNPIVRAILLEMQRRKINTGADGIRVDGAQDFKFLNPRTGRVEYDDAYLREMSNVIQEIDGQRRKLFAIFEDGRPWPQEGWEELSTYRDVIDKQPEVYQWGPLIFAHNTPTLRHFWDKKWRRVCEVMAQGDRWITGCGNHDTMRRGTQVDTRADVNWNLGQTLPDVIRTAYDNPAVSLLFYGFAPGLPMDFLNALMRSPWCFFRNTDDYFGLKVIAEEVGFLDWQIDANLFNAPDMFLRVKGLGVQSYHDLRRFMVWLNKTVTTMQDNYDLTHLAGRCQRFLKTSAKYPFAVSVQTLKQFARAYMEDCHDVCNVAHYDNYLKAEQTHFNYRLREFRRQHPWLGHNLRTEDCFDRQVTEQHSLYFGYRTQPDSSTANAPQRVAILCHMGGDPLETSLADLFPADQQDWSVAIASPGMEVPDPFTADRPLQLQDGQGILFTG